MTAATGNFGFDIDGGTTASTLQGSAKADSINGGDAADSLVGNAGNDTINGDGGNDTVSGGAGDDTFTFTSGTTDQGAGDVINGGTGNDTFVISAAVAASAVSSAEFDFDNISNLLNIQTVGIGDDDENQTVVVSDIAETTAQVVVVNGSSLNSAADSADLVVTNNADSATTRFSITGGSGADTINGSIGNDTISGGDGADSLIGGTGTDSMLGGGGADLIDAGAGADVITGGTGNDDFLYRASTEGTDSITDWATGTNQVIFTADDLGTTGDVFDDGKITFGGTDPTAVAGAVVALVAADYDEQSGTASAIQDNHVNVFTVAAGFTSANVAINTSSDANALGDNTSFFLVYFNSTASQVQLAYVSDAGTVAADRADATISTLASFSTASTAIAAEFGEGNFGTFSLA
jgi:Ca2+-binding RTX toxin-like protein